MRISDWSSDVCSSDQIDQTPANNTMDRRDRTALDRLNKRPALSIIESRPFARRLAIKQTIGTSGVEANHPVTHNLQAHPADPRRCSRSEEHTSELQSLMRISYAVFCLTKKINIHKTTLPT